MYQADFHFYQNRFNKEVKNLANQPCLIYTFLSAVQGNWRNAVYVECEDTTCRRRCSGFLLSFDRDGKAVLLPDDFMGKLTGHAVDKSECTAVISRRQFDAFSSLWLAWLTDSGKDCPAVRFMRSCDHRGRSCLPE